MGNNPNQGLGTEARLTNAAIRLIAVLQKIRSLRPAVNVDFVTMREVGRLGDQVLAWIADAPAIRRSSDDSWLIVETFTPEVTDAVSHVWGMVDVYSDRDRAKALCVNTDMPGVTKEESMQIMELLANSDFSEMVVSAVDLLEEAAKLVDRGWTSRMSSPEGQVWTRSRWDAVDPR